MPRPKKNPDDVKDKDLRIPVTIAQKQTVADAMAIDGREFAGWARTLILAEVDKLLAAHSDSQKLSGAKRKR